MSVTLLAIEPTIRLVAFLGVLAAMVLWEVAAPRRREEFRASSAGRTTLRWWWSIRSSCGCPSRSSRSVWR